MPMKTSVVIADGSFETNTAPLLGSIDEVFSQAAELGYDAVSVTVNRPEDVDVEGILQAMEKYGVAVSGLATGRIYTVDGFTLGSSDEANRMEAVNRMLGHAEICAKLKGAKLIIGAIRGWTKDAGSRENYEKQFRKSMETLVGQVDISDVDRMAPDGKHFDFPLFMKALHEVGYQDYLLSEYRAAPPENAAKVGLDYIKTLM